MARQTLLSGFTVHITLQDLVWPGCQYRAPHGAGERQCHERQPGRACRRIAGATENEMPQSAQHEVVDRGTSRADSLRDLRRFWELLRELRHLQCAGIERLLVLQHLRVLRR